MLENTKAAYKGLEKLVSLAKNASDIEGAGIFSAVTIICRDWKEHNDSLEVPGSAYQNQKIIDIEQHIRAMFDFENYSEHDREAHFHFAYSSLQDLGRLIE